MLVLQEHEQQLLEEMLPVLEEQIRTELADKLTPEYELLFARKLQELSFANLPEEQAALNQTSQDMRLLLDRLREQTSQADLQIEELLARQRKEARGAVIFKYLVEQLGDGLLQTQAAQALSEQVTQEAHSRLQAELEAQRARLFKTLHVDFKKKIEREQKNAVAQLQGERRMAQMRRDEAKQMTAEFARERAQSNVELKKLQQEVRDLQTALREQESRYWAESSKLVRQAKEEQEEDKRLIKFYGDELMEELPRFQPQIEQAQCQKVALPEIHPNSLRTDMRVYLDLTLIKQRLQELGAAQALPAPAEPPKFKQSYERALAKAKRRG